MIVLGAIEIGRIFFFPYKGITTIESTTNEPVMASNQFVFTVICLSLAAVLLVAGGIISIRDSRVLENSLKSKEVKE